MIDVNFLLFLLKEKQDQLQLEPNKILIAEIKKIRELIHENTGLSTRQ